MAAVCLLLAPAAGFWSPLHAQQSSSQGMEQQFEQAMAAQNRGDLDRTQSILTSLHRQHPGIFAVDESLGLLLASRGEAARALPLLQAAAQEDPHSDAARANLGAALYQLHRNQAALQQFQQAVDLNPRNLSALQSLGRLALETSHPARAARALQAALRLDPGNSDLQLDTATALLAAGRVDETKSLIAALPGAEHSARAQSLLGEVCEKQGRFQQAAQHLANAAALDPSEENAWRLGVEFLRHWTFTAAATEFRAASAKFPASRRLRLALGAALFGDAQYQQAIPVFAGLLGEDTNNAVYARLLGISCNAYLEGIDPRCESLIVYAQSHPADAQSSTEAATLLITRRKDEALARAFLEHALAADPHSAQAQFQMARVLQDGQDWAGSIPYLLRAVRLQPAFSSAHYRLGLAYARVGRRQEAQAEMQLQKKYSAQEQEDLDRRLRHIARFVVDVH